MRNNVIVSAVLLAVFGSAYAASSGPDADDSGVPDQQVNAAKESPILADFCFVDGSPPSNMPYSVLRKVKHANGTYGSVSDALVIVARNAMIHGADAVIEYRGSQRAGFMPWRLVHPVVKGTEIRCDGPEKPDCKAAGGMTLQEILATNKGPAG